MNFGTLTSSLYYLIDNIADLTGVRKINEFNYDAFRDNGGSPLQKAHIKVNRWGHAKLGSWVTVTTVPTTNYIVLPS